MSAHRAPLAGGRSRSVQRTTNNAERWAGLRLSGRLGDRPRLRQANRIVHDVASGKVRTEGLTTIDAPDLLANRVFGRAATNDSPLSDETENTFDSSNHRGS